MQILINFLLAIYVLVALLMLLVILMQRPKSEGLGAAFGGGVTENIFGAQTTNVLVKFTGYLAAMFFCITFALSILYAKQGSSSDSTFRKELLKTQGATPQASVAPGATQPVPAGSPAAVSSSPVAAPVASVVPSVPAPVTTASAEPSAGASVAPAASTASPTHPRRKKP